MLSMLSGTSVAWFRRPYTPSRGLHTVSGGPSFRLSLVDSWGGVGAGSAVCAAHEVEGEGLV